MRTLLTLVLTFTLQSAHATVFTDRASFDAAVGENTLLTFDTPPTVTVFTLYEVPVGQVQIGDVLASNIADLSYFQNHDDIAGSFCFCSGFGVGADYYIETIVPVVALSLDVTPFTPGTAFLFAGQLYTVTGTQFLGVVMDQPTILRFSPGYNRPELFSIDNVAVKTVPEPSYILALPLLFMALGVIRAAKWG